MSLGIKSGVNWIRLNVRCSVWDSVETRSVFANPGTPTSNAWLRVITAMSVWSTTSSWPTMTLASSVLIFVQAVLSCCTACKSPSTVWGFSGSVDILFILAPRIKSGKSKRRTFSQAGLRTKLQEECEETAGLKKNRNVKTDERRVIYLKKKKKSLLTSAPTIL